jgi:uncharacterized coiled-coil protein SlyX
MTPRPESRISALEKRTTAPEAQIEELSSDQAEELKAIRQEMKSSFKEIGETFINLEESIEKKLTAMENRLNANIADLKESLLDAIKQLWQYKSE